MKGKKVLSVLLIIVLIFLTAGCGKESTLDKNTEMGKANNKVESKEENPEYGGTLVVPITTIYTLNPLLAENVSYYQFSKLIFEGLFEFDNDLNVKNVLAEDYSIKDGGRVVDVSLKKDVKWHDGKDFTAEDVKFTIDTIRDGKEEMSYRGLVLSGVEPFGGSNIKNILRVEVLDDYNLQVIFDKTYSNALETLTFPIIPKHVSNNERGKKEKASGNEDLEVDNYIPIGTGPYKFSKYEKFKTIKLISNDNWWKGKPYIENIVGKIVEDKKLAMTAFETGQVDLIAATGADWEKYAQNKNVYEFVSPNYDFLAFNFSKDIFNGEKGLAVRKAIAYGVDRQAIIEEVYLGHATQTDVPIYPNSWLVTENANVYSYDKEKAKEVLEKAGWFSKDGIYQDENGKKLSIRLTTGFYNRARLKAANMIEADLKKIGIEVIRDYDEYIPDKMTEDMMEKGWESFDKKISGGNFDMALLGWKISSVPNLSFAFHSSQISGGTNFIKYKNEKVDELLLEAFSISTRKGKEKAYKELELELVKDLPYVSLFFRNDSLIMNKKVHGNIKPEFYNIFNNIEEWYIPKSKESKK